MKKTITLIAAFSLAGTSSAALSHFKSLFTTNVLIAKSLKTTSNSNVGNVITDYLKTSAILKLGVTLSNSDYNGFQGFLDQIDTISMDYSNHGWAMYFFQWLDDDNFSSEFPGLNHHTQQGFWHWPFTSSGKLENYMQNFGLWYDGVSDVAKQMLYSYGSWRPFGQHVEDRWNAQTPSGKVTGIKFTFNFSYDVNHDSYHTDTPPAFQILY